MPALPQHYESKMCRPCIQEGFVDYIAIPANPSCFLSFSVIPIPLFMHFSIANSEKLIVMQSAMQI